MMKYGFLVIIFSVFCFSCSPTRSGGLKQIAISDYQTDRTGAVIIDDRALDYNQKQIGTTAQSTEESAKRNGDSSLIKTMIDGFGNKIETRIFNDHPLLHRIIIRTFVNGRKAAFVYGQNGDVNDLPVEMHNQAMNASADELAKSAGIFTGRDLNDLPDFLQITTQKSISEDFLPLPVETVSNPLPKVNLEEEESAPIIEKSPVADANTKEKFADYQSEINKMSLTQTTKSSSESESKPKTQIEMIGN